MSKLFDITKLTIGFLIGFLICELYIVHTDFIFKNEIDTFGIFSLLVTTFLAVYVLRKLNKTDEGEKIELNLLINYITVFESDLTKVMRNVGKGGLEYPFVAAIMKRYNIRIQNLIKLGIEQKFLKSDSSMQNLFEKKISNIKELLTNTPKQGEVEDGIRLKENKLFYSSNQLDKIANALFEINGLVFKLIVEINRSNRS